MASTTISAPAPTVEGCPIFPRLKVYTVKQRVWAALAHSFYQNGVPVTVANGANGVLVIREATIRTGTNVDSFSVVATGASNQLQATLPQDWCAANKARIYNAEWYLLDAPYPGGNVIQSDPAWLVIERSLIAGQNTGQTPTITEVRRRLYDSSRKENMLIQDREFADDQIVSALVRAISDWNDTMPPPDVTYLTDEFPWPHQWIIGACGYLFEEAANRYMRNSLQLSAPVADPLNKEKEYRQIAAALSTQWQQFVLDQKWSQNMRSQFGQVPGTTSVADYGSGVW